MSWTGSINDQSTAFKMAGSGNIAVNILGLVDADFASLATAQAACVTKQAALSICDQIFAVQCSRGFKIASDLGAVFSGTKAAFFASLPANSHERQAISG